MHLAIIGAPNVGKSTLVNSLVGEKIAITSPKAQTTRARVRGIFCHGMAQIVIVDTAGIYSPSEKYEKAMVKASLSEIEDSDKILFVINAEKGICVNSARILPKLSDKKPIIALNKVDLLSKNELLPLIAEISAKIDYDKIFLISALKKDGLGDLCQYLEEIAPEGAWQYPAEQLADISERFYACEITREKIFLLLQEELPYGVMVEHEEFTHNKDNSITIRQKILIQREAHKKIIIGKKASRLKEIGSMARADMERIFGCKINLFLFVQVQEKWKERSEYLNDF